MQERNYGSSLDRKASSTTKKTHLYWLHYRTLERFIYQEISKSHSPFLDFGAGSLPYREYYPESSVTVDVDKNLAGIVDFVVSPGEKLPFDDSSFNTFFSSQVLEHVENPEFVIIEAARILKPGGKIILTAPFVWELHEVPHDYLRYSPFWYSEHLKNRGFTDIIVTSQGGDIATLAQMNLLILAHTRFGRIILRPLLIKAYNLFFGYLDERKPMNFMPMNYGVVATRGTK